MKRKYKSWQEAMDLREVKVSCDELKNFRNLPHDTNNNRPYFTCGEPEKFYWPCYN